MSLEAWIALPGPAAAGCQQTTGPTALLHTPVTEPDDQPRTPTFCSWL